MDDSIQRARGHWQFLHAENGAGELLMRFRTERPLDVDIDAYSTAVIIKWKYPRVQGSALPSVLVMGWMEVFGEAVADLAWGSGCSYLMNISTGVGMREWCYYTKDRAEFMRRFNALLAGHNPYPLEFEYYKDPEWKVWLDLRSAHDRFEPPPSGAS